MLQQVEMGRNSEAATAPVSVIKCLVLECWCLKIAANAALALAKRNVIEGRSYNRSDDGQEKEKTNSTRMDEGRPALNEIDG